MTTKSNLLKALEKNKGEFISGQELAQILDVSRTSVWKAIKNLQNEGYPIEAVTNKGYKLATESRILSKEALGEFIDSVVDIDSISILKIVDSTNNEAKRMIIDGAKPGTVVMSEEQSSGKGRMGRSFSSPPGDSIYTSFILQPLLDVRDSLLITVAASVAVARAVEKMGAINHEEFKPQIKWVNDVYLDNKKICGILTEAVSNIENGQIQSLVLGIGVNVNIDLDTFPEEIRNIIGSIDIKPGQRNQFAATLINEVFRIQKDIYDYSSSELNEPAFMKEYREKSLVIGREILVIRDNGKREATALDIDNHGGLLVKYKTGETELLTTGEISIRLNE